MEAQECVRVFVLAQAGGLMRVIGGETELDQHSERFGGRNLPLFSERIDGVHQFGREALPGRLVQWNALCFRLHGSTSSAGGLVAAHLGLCTGRWRRRRFVALSSSCEIAN